jgi:teichuronic acid biosynthesis glycosyltransferase TuaC
MRILHLYRGYGKDGENTVVDFQLRSFEGKSIEIYKFIIAEGGILGYLKATQRLKKYIISNQIDIVHSHYSYSGFLAILATRRPIICSLMGSDILQKKKLEKWFIYISALHFWNRVIVKNKLIQSEIKKSTCIPNGVDFTNFSPFDKKIAQERLGFNPVYKHIIFAAKDPNSAVKNLKLAQSSISLLNDGLIQFHLVSEVSYCELPIFYNAADLLLLTSLSEGSPNVIKEAMACNCPIVATDVGDIREVIGDTAGCYVTSFDPLDVAEKIRMALDFGQRTLGREKIGHLDNQLIADQILEVYREVLAGKNDQT